MRPEPQGSGRLMYLPLAALLAILVLLVIAVKFHDGGTVEPTVHVCDARPLWWSPQNNHPPLCPQP